MSVALREQTITDFGDQWGRYTDNSGLYGSVEFFADILGPLVAPDSLKGRKVMDIGSGSGRIVQMLLGAGAAHVVAVEPALAAFETLKTNTASLADRITYINQRGDEVSPELQVDDVVSIGVIHHIPDPVPVIAACYEALKPNGRCILWLYGYEGNELYLSVINPLRWFTVKLPHVVLAGLCHMLNAVLSLYTFLCRWLPLPMRGYATGVLAKLPSSKRYLIIYDQLNPAYAKYYREAEAKQLLLTAGFKDVQTYHRHGYSWTVVGTKA